MSLLARVRPPVSPAPAVPAAPAQYGAELADDDLEQVVGGLERIYVPAIYAARD